MKKRKRKRQRVPVGTPAKSKADEEMELRVRCIAEGLAGLDPREKFRTLLEVTVAYGYSAGLSADQLKVACSARISQLDPLAAFRRDAAERLGEDPGPEFTLD